MSDEKAKAGGSGRLTTILVFGVAFAGYKYYTERPKPPAPKLTRAELDSILSGGAAVPMDATGRCLEALGGNCFEKPCPVVQAAQIVAAKGLQVADSEDIAHSTLIEVCLKATDTEGPREWTQALISRAKFRRIDYARGSARRCAYDDAIDASRSLRGVLPDESDRGVRRAVCGLERADRCVLWARYWDDLDDSAIAERCKISSTSMVRKQLERARNRLRTALNSPKAPAIEDSGFRSSRTRRLQDSNRSQGSDRDNAVYPARWDDSPETEPPSVQQGYDDDDD